MNILFSSGDIVVTRGALYALQELDVEPRTLLDRHFTGDYGDLTIEDKASNDLALINQTRILSKYNVGKYSFYVITEHDRSYTTLMLTEDY